MTLIASLVTRMSLEHSSFSTGLKQMRKESTETTAAITKSLSSLKSLATVALGGFAAAFSSGVLIELGRRALEYASSLGEISQQLGVTTKDLQVFRYAASQVGLSQDEMDKALRKMVETLGKVAAGSEAPIKALRAIGITAAEIKGKDAGQAMRMIADGLENIPDRAQRAAVELAIFGQTGAKLDTLLSGGSKAINELEEAAYRLGIVLSDEQIQKADETADKLAALKQVIEARIAGAVADNADAILALASALATLVGWLGKAASAYRDFRDAAKIGQANFQKNFGASAQIRFQGAMSEQQFRNDRTSRRNKELGPLWSPSLFRAPVKPVSTGVGDIDQFLAPKGPRGRKGPKGKSAETLAREAERKRQAALRDAYNAAEDERRAALDILQAQQSLSHDINERADIQETILGKERESELAQIEFNLGMGDINATQAAKQKALAETLYGLRIEKLKQDEAFDQQQEVIRQRKAIADSAMEVAEMEANLTETAAERRKIELQILDARFRQLRQAQQDIIDNDRTSPEEKNAAGRRLIDLDKLQAGAATQTMRGTRGPLETFLATLPNTAAKANEALENIAANGLQSLTDGLTEAIMGARSLGDVFSAVAKQIIAELIRIQIQKSIIGPLSSALGGLFGGGGAEFLSLGGMKSAPGGRVPAFATGGTFTVRGKRGYDTNLLSLNNQPIANVNYGERVSVGANDNGRRGTTVINMNGVMTTDQFWAHISQLDADSSVRGAASAIERIGRTKRRTLA